MAEDKPRRPGRPRKNPVPAPIEMNGIVDSPEDPENIIEWIYHEPMNLKKIFTIMKGIESKNAMIVFEKDGVIITSEGHFKKNKINLTVNGNAMPRYYCGVDSLERQFSFDRMYTMMSKLNRNYERIEFSVRAGEEGEKMRVRMVDPVVGDSSYHEIIFKFDDDISPQFIEYDTKESIRFRLSTSKYKSIVSSVPSYTKYIRFMRQNGVLSITTSDENRQDIDRTVFDDDKKIHLHDRLAKDDFLCITMRHCYMKSFSKAALGDEVKIYLYDDEQPIRVVYNPSKGAVILEVTVSTNMQNAQ
jgi:hypothetical protein